MMEKQIWEDLLMSKSGVHASRPEVPEAPCSAGPPLHLLTFLSLGANLRSWVVVSLSLSFCSETIVKTNYQVIPS